MEREPLITPKMLIYATIATAGLVLLWHLIFALIVGLVASYIVGSMLRKIRLHLS